MNSRRGGVLLLTIVGVAFLVGGWCLEVLASPFSLPPLSDDDIEVVVQHPYSTFSYWKHEFSEIDGDHSVKNSPLAYRGWCVDMDHYISGNVTYSPVHLYVTYPRATDPDIFNESPGSDFDEMFHTDDPVSWRKVNWIINHYTGYTWRETQCAIWGFINGGVKPSLNDTGGDCDCDGLSAHGDGSSTTDADALWQAATSKGGFYPEKDIHDVAVAVYVSASHQGTIIQVPTDEDIPVELSSFRATSQDGGVVLQWVTASETGNLGFHVYRSLAKDGAYERISPALIEGAGSSRIAETYQFVDQRVESGKTYYYRLHQVDFTGTVSMYDPTEVTVTAKPALQATTWGMVKALLK